MDIHLEDSIVAINQTRSQEDKVFRDKKCHYTYVRLATKHRHSQEQFA